MYEELKDAKNPAKAKMGKATTMDAKRTKLYMCKDSNR